MTSHRNLDYFCNALQSGTVEYTYDVTRNKALSKRELCFQLAIYLVIYSLGNQAFDWHDENKGSKIWDL